MNNPSVVQQRVFDVRTFGAVTGGVHDDAPAIRLAMAAAQAVGGVVFCPNVHPGGTTIYGVGSTIATVGPVKWVGQKGTVIRAIGAPGAMTCTVSVQSITLASLDGSTYSEFTDLVFDAGNGVAQDALHRLGDFNSIYTRCDCVASNREGMLAVTSTQGATISPVTVSGGGVPGALVVTQRDPLYMPNQLGGNFAAKCIAGGALGVATFALSLDGGVTYPSFTQGIFAACNPCIASVATPLYDSGLRFVWEARVYAPGEVYAFTVAPFSEIGGGTGGPLNVNARFNQCQSRSCGTTFDAATGDSWASFCNQVVPVLGTASCAGTQLVTFAGASLLATNAREGDYLFFSTGLLVGIWTVLTCVLDDNHIILSAGQALPTVAGVPYAVVVGNGYREDSSAHNNSSQFVGCIAQTCGFGWRFGGPRGATMIAPFSGECAAGNWSTGTAAQAAIQGLSLVHPYWEDNAIPGSAGMTLYVDAQASATYIDCPLSPFITQIRGTGPVFIGEQFAKRTVGGANTVELLGAINCTTSVDITSSPAFQFPTPSFGAATTGPSAHAVFLLAGQLTLTSAAPIAPPAREGQVVIIFNTGFFGPGALILPAAGNNLRQPADLAIAPGQGAAYMSVQGAWYYLWGGTLKTSGVATLNGTTLVVVPYPNLTANSRIALGVNTVAGTPGVVSAPQASRVPGTSFSLVSSNVLDTSTVDWTVNG
jgi:hypothetical protein